MNIICGNNKNLMTVKEAKEKYKGCKNLKIETNEQGYVTQITFERPCIYCGGYHKPFSKEVQKCMMNHIMKPSKESNEEDTEDKQYCECCGAEINTDWDW